MYNMKHLWFEKGAYANKKSRDYLANNFSQSEVKKIAVIRHAALGDQVITRPFLIELRKFFPNATITLSAVSNYQYGMPDDLVDKLHMTHGSDKKADITFKEKIANFKELGEQDIIFDLAATNRSYWLCALNKAKLKIGFPYGHWTARALYDIALFRSDFTAELEVMLDMLRILGHNPIYPLDYAYPNHEEDAQTNKPYIVYFNGASQERKMYPFDKMKTLLLEASEALPDHQHVYLEGLNSNEKGDQLGDLSAYKNIHMQNALPLDELLNYIAKSSAVVSTDTGIRNLAIATHTPTVGIFYATVPFRYTPITGKHRLAMNADATIPSPSQIIHKLQEIT
jgi:ADP-heptose:LPS heptosyltransferase